MNAGLTAMLAGLLMIPSIGCSSTHRLKIEQYDAFPGQKEPPQDASRYGYRLIEVISKTSR